MTNKLIIPARFALVDIRLIGTHEQINSEKYQSLIESLNNGNYYGAAIAVFQQFNDELFNRLESNSLTRYTPNYYGEIGIADGHNRLAVLNYFYKTDKLKVLKYLFRCSQHILRHLSSY